MYFRDHVLTSQMDYRRIGDVQIQSHLQITPALPENQTPIVKQNKNGISDGSSNEDTLSTTSDVESVLSEAGSTASSSAGLVPIVQFAMQSNFIDDFFTARGLMSLS